MGKLNKIIREEIDDFDWTKGQDPKVNLGYKEVEINTEIANKYFQEEKNGNYVISTPKGKKFPETILAYGSVSYVKKVLSYINDNEIYGDIDLYLGNVKYSNKEKDNVLTLTKYY